MIHPMSSFTCLLCPNGCGLSVYKREEEFVVRGNRCKRGVAFARNKLNTKGVFVSEKSFLHYSNKELQSVLDCWGLPLQEIDERKFIQGSPERSLYRTLVRCEGEPLILEQIEKKVAFSHESTAKRLEIMKEKGLPVTTFRQGLNGQFIQKSGGHIWQLTPFVLGIPLNRKDFDQVYWNEGWRGEALGKFLCQLYDCQEPEPGKSFNIEYFIYGLMKKIPSHSSLFLPLLDILSYLEENLFPHLVEIPTVFGHGDPHPLNIIWGENNILSVVDWEFCGNKPLLYDGALIMGCVGSETPDSIKGDFNSQFYATLSANPLFKKSLPYLSPFILAQRFAWLNEWLRHEDREMQEQEITYLKRLTLPEYQYHPD